MANTQAKSRMWKMMLVLLTVCVCAFFTLAAAAEGETAPVEAEEAVTADEQAAADQPISYDYNAGLYNPESGEYPGVYGTEIEPNSATAETAPTIGMPSIADGNLDVPTTESPAIIQGAAVGYEEKVGATEYETLKERVEPYTDYKVTVLEETGTDGTVHRKLSGFDGTYVILRLDVTGFYTGDAEALATQYLHMKQEQNRALIPGMGMMDGDKAFADMNGNKTGAYLLSDLVDKDGEVPYLDILLFATAANVAGADAGKENMPTGDVPLQIYVDDVADYNPELTYDPQSTDTNHQTNCLAKFFDASKVLAEDISRYLIKGSDLALEVAVENSSGPNRDEETTYWSLEKALQDPYYDQEADTSADDPACGRTVKLISEVAVTEGIAFTGSSGGELRKRTLDVNSFDIQVANNTAKDEATYSDGLLLKNAWLTIADKSNTTGAEMAIGNNAKFVIDEGGKLIIDETCQLEIEWDGATTTPVDGQEPQQPDILNNGMLDLRAGGEIVNNGIITIEGTEGKPYQPDQPPAETDKGCGELTIEEGATLTNNGSLVVYGKLYNLGTLVNNGKYDDVIISNDPDQGQFAYHRGIVIAWKDDVTQANVVPGSLVNGKDRDGNTAANARLENNGDILLAPGKIENYESFFNTGLGNTLLAAAVEAIIPITPTAEAPTVVTKRITLDPPVGSSLENYGTIVNEGRIMPASVAINDNTSFGALTTPGDHPELFALNNHGTVVNYNYIYGFAKNADAGKKLIVSIEKEDGAVLYLYEDKTFDLVSADGAKLAGTFTFEGTELVFTQEDGAQIRPETDENGDSLYTFTLADGQEAAFILEKDVVAYVYEACLTLSAQNL